MHLTQRQLRIFAEEAYFAEKERREKAENTITEVKKIIKNFAERGKYTSIIGLELKDTVDKLLKIINT